MIDPNTDPTKPALSRSAGVADPVNDVANPGFGWLRVLGVGAASLGFASVINKVLTFAGNTIAARVAGPETFGRYAFAILTASTAATYLGVGVDAVASRFAGSVPKGSLAYNRTMSRLAIYAGGAILLTVGGLFWSSSLLTRYLNGQPLELARLSAAVGGVLVLVQFVQGLVLGLFNYRAVVVLNLLSGLALLTGLGFAADLGARALLVAYLLAFLLASLFTIAAFHRQLFPRGTLSQTELAPPAWATMGRFGLGNVVSGAGIAFASWYVGSLVIRVDPSAAQMSFYTVASQLNTIVVLLPTMVSQVLLPIISRLNDVEHERVVFFATLATCTTGIGLGSILLICVPEVLALWGPEYASARLPSVALITAGVLQMCMAPRATALRATRIELSTAINLAWSVILASLGTWLIPRHGALGAAIAWVVAFSASNVILYFVGRWTGTSSKGIGSMALATSCGCLVMGVTSWRLQEAMILYRLLGQVALLLVWMIGFLLILKSTGRLQELASLLITLKRRIRKPSFGG